MSGKIFNLRKRLKAVERRLTSLSDERQHADCICRTTTIADEHKPEEFEAEMDRVCLRHGHRRLGLIMTIRHVGNPGTGRLDQLLKTYRARLSPQHGRLLQLRRVGSKLKDGFQED